MTSGGAAAEPAGRCLLAAGRQRALRSRHRLRRCVAAPDPRRHRAARSALERIPSYATVDPRLQEAAWHYVDGKHYGVPYQWGPNVLMYNTETFKTAADLLVGGVRAAEAAGRQAQQGPRAGLRRAYLHRRCRAVPDGEEARARHQGSVRAQRGAVRRGARAAARPASADPALLARRQRAGAGLPERRHRRLGLLAVPGEHAARQQGEGRHHGAGRRRDRLGRHHHARRRRQASELRLQVARVVDLAEGAG